MRRERKELNAIDSAIGSFDELAILIFMTSQAHIRNQAMQLINAARVSFRAKKSDEKTS